MRILYIDIDTLRPDHLGCYGYNRDTSPNIDRIAGEATVFENYYCSDAPCLPTTLKEHGLHTCCVGGFAERHSAYPLYAGFREIHDTGKGGMESAENVSPSALEWIRNHGADDDWYLHVNYWDPHTLFRAPEDFGNPFVDDPLPEFFSQDLIVRHRGLTGPKTIQDITMYDNVVDPRYRASRERSGTWRRCGP